jgi:hypothetical protein
VLIANEEGEFLEAIQALNKLFRKCMMVAKWNPAK